MKRLKIVIIQCHTCGFEYDADEHTDCPQCERMHILSKDFLKSTDDSEDIDTE